MHQAARMGFSIHIKPSTMDEGGHWSFTRHYAEKGRITPEALLEAVKADGRAVASWPLYTHTGYI